jgi:hypothetical protein
MWTALWLLALQMTVSLEPQQKIAKPARGMKQLSNGRTTDLASRRGVGVSGVRNHISAKAGGRGRVDQCGNEAIRRGCRSICREESRFFDLKFLAGQYALSFELAKLTKLAQAIRGCGPVTEGADVKDRLPASVRRG